MFKELIYKDCGKQDILLDGFGPRSINGKQAQCFPVRITYQSGGLAGDLVGGVALLEVVESINRRKTVGNS